MGGYLSPEEFGVYVTLGVLALLGLAALVGAVAGRGGR